MFDHEQNKILRTIEEELDGIRHELREIVHVLRELVVHVVPAVSFHITQGDTSMAITGVPAGGQDTFFETPVPAGGQLQPGSIPSWTVDDAAVTLLPSADGTSVLVQVAAGDTNASFNLTVSGVSSNGTPINGTTSVPILPAAGTPATGFTIDQGTPPPARRR